jgi:hypothetical protein
MNKAICIYLPYFYNLGKHSKINKVRSYFFLKNRKMENEMKLHTSELN